MRDPQTIKTLKMTAQMGRGNQDSVSLQIEDEASHLLILEASMELGEFVNLLTNRQAEMTGKFSTNPNIGKRHEGKSIQVPLPEHDYTERTEAWLNAVIQAYAAEHYPEWKADYERGWNGHRYSRDPETYQAFIRRYV